jgi:hypothetical protein
VFTSHQIHKVHVFWYHDQTISVLPVKSLVPFKDGKAQDLHKVPESILLKLQNGDALTQTEDDVLQGYNDMLRDARKEPAVRKNWLCNFKEDFEMNFGTDESDVEEIDEEASEDDGVEEDEEEDDGEEDRKPAARGNKRQKTSSQEGQISLRPGAGEPCGGDARHQGPSLVASVPGADLSDDEDQEPRDTVAILVDLAKLRREVREARRVGDHLEIRYLEAAMQSLERELQNLNRDGVPPAAATASASEKDQRTTKTILMECRAILAQYRGDMPATQDDKFFALQIKLGIESLVREINNLNPLCFTDAALSAAPTSRRPVIQLAQMVTNPIWKNVHVPMQGIAPDVAVSADDMAEDADTPLVLEAPKQIRGEVIEIPDSSDDEDDDAGQN